MSNEIQTVKEKAGLIHELATKFNVAEADLKKTLEEKFFADMGREDRIAFCIVANKYGLDPFTKEIYAMKFKNKWVPYISVDGWLRIINEHPMCDGICPSVSEDGKTATCTIHRKDRKYPTTVTEYLDECMPKRVLDESPWKTHPRRMLQNKAIIQCGRIAFGLSGFVDYSELKEEAEQQKYIVPENRATSFVDILQQKNAEAKTKAPIKPQADEFLEALEEQN